MIEIRLPRTHAILLQDVLRDVIEMNRDALQHTDKEDMHEAIQTMSDLEQIFEELTSSIS